jgi:hypothetical protein
MWKRGWWLLLGLGLLAGCVRPERATPAVEPGQTAADPAELPSRGLAAVESLSVDVLEGQPVTVSVTAGGRLPESCVTLDHIDQSQVGSTFAVRLETVRRPAEGCLPEPAPFEVTVSLNVLGLAAGVYGVDVNGLKGSFTLRRDNIVDLANAVVRGRVWDDLCALTGAGRGEGRATEGCVVGPEGTLRANGRWDVGEAPLHGVVVELGAGQCPSRGLAATLTDEDGVYLFGGLRAGLYCLSIDAAHSQNQPILTTGLWTAPEATAGGQMAVLLAPGETRLDLDFGWDRASGGQAAALQGAPSAERRNCVDRARFLADVTMRDNAVVAAGQPFTKIWRLRNDGSCAWGPGYSAVFVEGEALGAPEFVPLTRVVAPGRTIDLAVELVAPSESGTYPSFWMLRNPEGVLFGLGDEADTPFWLQVVVP